MPYMIISNKRELIAIWFCPGNRWWIHLS